MRPRLFVLLGLFAVGCLTPVDDRDGGAGGGSAAGGGGSAAGGGGATGGGGASGGGGGSSSGGGGGGASGGGGGQACSPACGVGRECCNGQCVNTTNDPFHCGGCNVVCSGATPHCAGTCTAPPCSIDAGVCGSGESCCGGACCGAGQLCCDVQGPVSGFATCHTPTPMEPTCPQGCQPLCASDRNLKTALAPIDERGVLDQVATLPITSWQYSSDPASTRHLGPMAQDFRATFNLGDTDRAYNSIDAHGVSLASIKALYRMVQEQQARLERLETENARLRAESASCR